MTIAIRPAARRLSHTIGRGLDEFFSARWWWRMRRARAEARLTSALERFGDQSMEVRHATEGYRRMNFAVTFWRSASGPVRNVVANAREAGVRLADLQLVVLNTDLRVSKGTVVVHRSWLARMLSKGSLVVIVSQWVLLCALAIASSAALWLKLASVAVISLIYMVLCRGWTLYTSRSIKAIDRANTKLSEICGAAHRGELRQLSESPVARKSN